MNEHLNICCVSQSFLPYVGGLTKYVQALGREFIKNGHQFTVLHFKTPKTDPVFYSDEIKMVRADVSKLGEETLKGYMKFKERIIDITHGKPRLYKPPPPGYKEYFDVNEEIADNLAKLHEEHKFDVINVHDFQVIPIGSFLKNKYGLDIPMVFTLHIPFMAEIPDWWTQFFLTYMGYYDKLVFSTEEYAAAAIKLGLPKEKVARISPFIDIERYSIKERNDLPIVHGTIGVCVNSGAELTHDVRKKYGISDNEKLVLCVSRIDPRKGQEVLISAMEILVKEFGHSDIKCIFVGNGSFSKELLKKERSERMENLRKMVNEKGLSGRILFTGRISDKEVQMMYQAANIVVQPSIQEGFGLTLSEAMVFSKPVIGSNVGGIPDQIDDGTNGYLFQPGNFKELAEKIHKILSDDGLADCMGLNGNKIIKESFTSEIGYRKYLGLYRSISRVTHA